MVGRNGGAGERVGVLGGGDGFQRVGPELAEHVEGAARELARDRQRRPGVAEPAGFEGEVVGVVGAAGPAR